jgi:hypothetical protein
VTATFVYVLPPVSVTVRVAVRAATKIARPFPAVASE